MIIQQQRYWNLHIYLKLYFILHLMNLFTTNFQYKKCYLCQG